MLHLLPVPRRLQWEEGVFSLAQELCIVVKKSCGLLARTGAKQLQTEIREACGLTVEIRAGKACAGDIFLTVEADGPAQGYALSVSTEGVRLAGYDEAGLLHGVQTLRQMIRQCGWTLPALTIDDAPDYPVRGFYHDQTRGRIGTMAWLKRLADEACFYKLNQLQLYVEHTYLYRELTELWATAVDPLTAEEIMELDAYCAARGVELVPSMSSFGHLLELLRTKSYAHLCETEGCEKMPSTMPNRMAHLTIDPCNPASFALIASMLDEYMALFRTNLFNVCADETFDLGKGRNRGKTEQELYMPFVKKLCAHVAATGRTPMFWGDIVLRFPEALRELPEGTICLNWGYSAQEQEDPTRILAQAGAKQYQCPGVCGWNQIIPRMGDSHENIRRMAEYGRRYGAVGFLNTDWGDYGHVNDPRFSLPGLAAGACASWGELPVPAQLWEALSVLMYSDRSGKALGQVAALSEQQLYRWWHIVQHMEWARSRLDEVRESSPMAHLTEVALREADDAIDRAVAGLQVCCLHMDAPHRAMIANWLTAAEGVRLWNHVGHAVSAGKKEPMLASRLEKWFRRYQTMWREVSRESELWRIREVCAWYADELR
ncbi:MAG: beta-N-acetylhexosaminidase [Clostridia bacterium]|nr:beta-N-acetylhexosaminidase [Clostridia bacterium]